MVSVGPGTPGFPQQQQSNSAASSPEMALAKHSFVLGSLQKGLGLSTCTFYELFP